MPQVPVVLLVVQGGPNTLDMMLASAREGSPLLILSDSGGAASRRSPARQVKSSDPRGLALLIEATRPQI